jgi:hypothetical protein
MLRLAQNANSGGGNCLGSTRWLRVPNEPTAHSNQLATRDHQEPPALDASSAVGGPAGLLWAIRTACAVVGAVVSSQP